MNLPNIQATDNVQSFVILSETRARANMPLSIFKISII